jgi:hypothetical protein
MIVQPVASRYTDYAIPDPPVCDRMSYIILRGRFYNIIVLNVHAPTEGKIDDTYKGQVL